MHCFCYLRSSCSVLRCSQNKTAWLDSAHGERAVVAGQILCLMFSSFSISSAESHADAIEKPEVQWTIHMHHREVFVANSYHLVQQWNNPLRHWRLKFTTDAKCNGATEGSKLHTKPSVFWKLSSHALCHGQVRAKKNGTDNIQPTACELPWLQRKGAWTALRSYACPADVAPRDPNHTWAGNPTEVPLVLLQTTDLFSSV